MIVLFFLDSDALSIFDFDLPVYTPVSYTHLDVYNETELVNTTTIDGAINIS
ncbi:hypothetical protein [Candidatus Enterococcus wittei]|uniref:hypothetical protein n=1 Tax=Candidatus Enterococcus wittei TaxID=1987383 RepID=UPI001C4F39AA|nr:hypothetical protein [Enterococcus sp. 10A9_DIV0425]